MPGFVKNRVYGSSSINDEKFFLFWDKKASKSFDWLYWQYPDFVLDSWQAMNARQSFVFWRMISLTCIKQ